MSARSCAKHPTRSRCPQSPIFLNSPSSFSFISLRNYILFEYFVCSNTCWLPRLCTNTDSTYVLVIFIVLARAAAAARRWLGNASIPKSCQIDSFKQVRPRPALTFNKVQAVATTPPSLTRIFLTTLYKTKDPRPSYSTRPLVRGHSY